MRSWSFNSFSISAEVIISILSFASRSRLSRNSSLRHNNNLSVIFSRIYDVLALNAKIYRLHNFLCCLSFITTSHKPISTLQSHSFVRISFDRRQTIPIFCVLNSAFLWRFSEQNENHLMSSKMSNIMYFINAKQWESNEAKIESNDKYENNSINMTLCDSHICKWAMATKTTKKDAVKI